MNSISSNATRATRPAADPVPPGERAGRGTGQRADCGATDSL